MDLSAYEDATAAWVSTATLLADALTRYGDVLAAMAYNWDISNQTIPHPDRPVESVKSGNPYSQRVVARASNGAGIEVKGVGLSHVEPIPNGDTGKLRSAKDRAWLACALHPDLADAGDRITKIGYNFDYSTEDNIAEMLARLNALRQAADGVRDASKVIDAAVDEYRSTLEVLRTSIKDRVESAISSVKVSIEPSAVTLKCAAPIFSKDLEDPVYMTVAVSKFVVAVTSMPFSKLPDLSFHSR
ncbi:hypothetical protein ACIA5E_11740 [Nocardia asteroides]|uniref:hypothetical protein n=1 Tax=Nocardia asteroides TaxID=1824 RepID=UPI00379646B7